MSVHLFFVLNVYLYNVITIYSIICERTVCVTSKPAVYYDKHNCCSLLSGQEQNVNQSVIKLAHLGSSQTAHYSGQLANSESAWCHSLSYVHDLWKVPPQWLDQLIIICSLLSRTELKRLSMGGLDTLPNMSMDCVVVGKYNEHVSQCPVHLLTGAMSHQMIGMGILVLDVWFWRFAHNRQPAVPHTLCHIFAQPEPIKPLLYKIQCLLLLHRICLDCNDTVNKLFHKCFINSVSIVHRSHHSHLRTRTNHCTP